MFLTRDEVRLVLGELPGTYRPVGELLYGSYFGDIVWRAPTIATVPTVLKNPAYAGAFVYGRTRTVPATTSAPRRTPQRRPMTGWQVVIRDKYPAYIDWATFEAIQAMIRDNYGEYDRNKTRGVPRPGTALLHGLVYCGGCGHKMLVQYKRGTRYICDSLRQKCQVPVCQCLPGDPIDDAVVSAFVAALSPVELDVYEHAHAANREHEQVAVAFGRSWSSQTGFRNQPRPGPQTRPGITAGYRMTPSLGRLTGIQHLRSTGQSPRPAR
jgi:hypothetical protein